MYSSSFASSYYKEDEFESFYSSSRVDELAEYRQLALELKNLTGIDVGNIEDPDEASVQASVLKSEFGIDVDISDLVLPQHGDHRPPSGVSHPDRGLDSSCSSSYSMTSCTVINTPCTGCHEDTNGGRHCCGCEPGGWIYACAYESSISSHSSSVSSSSISSSSISSSSSSKSSSSRSSSSQSRSSSSAQACNWSDNDYVRVSGSSVTTFEGWVNGNPTFNGSCDQITIYAFKWNDGGIGASYDGCCNNVTITQATQSPCKCAREQIQGGDSISSWPAYNGQPAGSNGIINNVYLNNGILWVEIDDFSGNTWDGPCSQL